MISNQAINASELPDNGFHQILRILSRRQLCLHSTDLGSTFSNYSLSGLAGFLITERYLYCGGGKHFDGRRANATGPTGDQGHFAGQR